MTLAKVEASGPVWKPWILWILKVAMSCLILWLAFRPVSLSGLKEALFQVNLPLASASIVFYPLLIIPCEAARLWFAGRLLQEDQPSFRNWIRIYTESRPFFYLLPAAVGAEGMVWLRLRKYHWQHSSCGFVVLSTRLMGVGVWALAAALALRFPNGANHILAQAPDFLSHPLPWAIGGTLMLGGIALAPTLLRRFQGLAAGRHRVAPLVGMLAFSLCSALITGISVQVAGMAACTPIALHSALGFMAFLNFAMVIPISVGGFGLQEALILALGLPIGYSAPALVAFSGVIHLQKLVLSMLGLAMFLSGRQVDEVKSHVLPLKTV